MSSPSAMAMLLVTLVSTDIALKAFGERNVVRRRSKFETIIDVCPESCACSVESPIDTGITVDCSGRNLVEIPHNLPHNTAKLLLGNNDIVVLGAMDLANCNRSLILLDLSRNQLQQLENGSLAAALHLQELYLDRNSLNVSELSTETFTSLAVLRVLRLNDNNAGAGKSAITYNDQLFAPLTRLHELTVDGIPNATFGSGFAELRQLQFLGVYGRMKVVFNETFASFKESPITELKIRCGLSLHWLEPMSFGHFRRLETLDLSYNIGLGLGDNLTTSWYGLQFTNISKLILTRVSNADADKLTKSFYKPLCNKTRITHLLVDKNSIVLFEPMLSDCLPHLEYFDMSYNRIGKVGSMIDDLWRLKQLRYLDMSHQDKRFHSKEDNGKDRLAAADSSAKRDRLRSARPRTRPQNIGADSRKDDLWFEQCYTPRLKTCPLPPIFDEKKEFYPVTIDQTWCIPPAPKLEILNLTQSANVELFDMPAIIIFGGSSLKSIVYQQNGYHRVVGPIIFTQPLNAGLMLDLSGNYISCLSPDAFNISYHLGVTVNGLDLSRNNLAYQLEIDERGRTFQFGPNTTVLNLSQNDIASLPLGIFRNLTSLQTLNLSRNFLRMIDFEFAHMKRLRQLDLSHNLLTNFDKVIQDKFSVAFAARQGIGEEFSLNLYGNPLECSCASLGLLQWMDANEVRLLDFRNYSCIFGGNVVSFVNLNNIILTELDFVCSKPLAVVISATMLALVLVLTTLSVGCYRYRWEIRYCCLRLTQRGKRYQLMVDQPAHRYDYDAFVVYDSADRDWVNEQLLPHLEPEDEIETGSRRPLRLCVHERDFPPGEDILGNIWNKMERSRKTILVISRTFMSSNYCNYETQLARLRSVEQGRNVIVPVLLEPIDGLRNMAECLRWVVRKLTYIEWPQHPVDRAEFWYRLRESVADGADICLDFQLHDN